MSQKLKLLIATNNKGKLNEIRAILKDLQIQLVSPVDIGLDQEVEEDGQTYAENAAKKALAFSQASGLTSLADDSGLEVDALGGKPGLHSNRFGPPIARELGRTDASRRAYLLEQLAGIPRPWTARFRATVAIVGPGRSVQLAEGICPGQIIPVERGSGGFGYDPIFLLDGLDKTMAELDMEEKNRLSHRGRAVRGAIPILIGLSGN
ncbi:MAG: RdgB/HAM1 family non-canonical purine NTP pyrophosphatase [Anaerolineales bacterium]|jgi:XTP/dITP diphosphohydrolase